MRIFFFFTLFTFFAVVGYAQHFDPQSYPKGVYMTFEEFKTKQPSASLHLSEPYTKDSIAYRFDDLDNRKRRFRDIFAISDGHDVYVQVINLIKSFPRSDRGQSYDGGVYFLKAQEKSGYLYLKDYFTSNNAAFMGGLIASAAARRLKGVVYDEKKQVFNLFKNIEDFKSFMQDNHPEINIDVNKKTENGEKLKEIDIIELNLKKIKTP